MSSPKKPTYNLWIKGFLSLGIFILVRCTPLSEPLLSPKETSTPVPTPDSYTLDLPTLGVRLRLPLTWQGVQTEGPERPWVFLVPFERYSDEEDLLRSPPLLQSEVEGILIPPDPPYLLIYAYQRPPSRPWHPREVYFGLTELGILNTEIVEDFGKPESFRVPRGLGWRSDLRLKGPAGEYRARLALLPMPFPQWTFALWGVAAPEQWPDVVTVFQQVLVELDFLDTPPVSETPDS